MQRTRSANTWVQPPVPREWARVIVKLRWIGLEEEAKRLENTLNTLSERKCGVSSVRLSGAGGRSPPPRKEGDMPGDFDERHPEIGAG